MITRLPRWVESGAFVLALIAGTINAIGLLGFEHQAVSHVSGTATQFGSGLFMGQWMHVIQLGGLVVGFFPWCCGVRLFVAWQHTKAGAPL